jgi:hypothetical protein
MGLAYTSTLPVGIMGVGYNTTEASEFLYANIIDSMVQQGLINTRAYSLWLDDLESSTGQILFGGIDTAKYSGSLSILPLQASAGESSAKKRPSSFTVTLSGLSAGNPGQTTSIISTEFAIPVVLDSGTTQTLLPASLINAIVDGLGAFDASLQVNAILVNCALREFNPDFVFAYRFGDENGPVITVNLSEMILDFETSNQELLATVFEDWEGVCYLAIADSSTVTDSPIYLLGDSFLRSAYVVYDIDNDEVGIAQSNFNSGSNKIVEIMSGAGIPTATRQPDNVSTAAPTATGLAGLAGLVTVRPKGATSTGGAGATATGARSGEAAAKTNAAVASVRLPAGGSAAVVMAVSLGFALLGVLLIVL